MPKVLVVDDEPDVRLIARIVLGAADHDVVEVGTGEAALALFDEGPPADVVLLDVRLPGLDGWEVLRRIRSDPATATLPVVVFTADLTASHDAPADLAGEVVLTKPFQADQLVDAVRRAGLTDA